MARQDVELIIRARNEASKAIDAVSKALEGLVDSQGKLAASAGKTDSTLGRLGSSLGTLSRQLRGMTAVQQVAAQMDRAAAAMGRMQAEAAQTAASQERFGREAEESATRVQRLTVAAEELGIATARQRAQLAGTVAAQQAYGNEIARAERQIARLSGEEARLTDQIARQGNVVTQAAQRYDQLRAKIEAVTEPSKTLSAAWQRASDSLAKHDAKLGELGARQANARAQVAALTATLAELRARLEQTNASFTEQSAALARTESGYRDTVASVRAAAQQQAQLEKAAEDTAASLAQQVAEINRTEAALAELAAESARAATAQGKLAAQVRGELLTAWGAQQAAMLGAQQGWREAEFAVRELALAMQQTQQPSLEMVANFNAARAAAKQAKAEFEAQRVAMHEMRTALRAAGTDFDALTATIKQFEAISATLKARLDQVEQEASQMASAMGRLGSATNTAAGGLRSLQAGSAGTAGAMGGAAARTGSFSAALHTLYGNSRQAMSITQRLRGEVLSLIAAYGGIFGVVQGIRAVIDATQTWERAQNRLGVIFEGSGAKAAQELDFIRRQADRLGISVGLLADQYTKFASSTLGTNIEGQKTRDIFISVAEAARVLGLSMEDTQGIFRALGQIASKGTVQMEELRGQLGDRFPAALKLMADGLGVTTKELEEMTKQGEVSADALLPFAEEIEKRYGPQLQDALEKTNALLGKLGNELFQALLKIANSGFIESFQEFLRTLTEWFQSAEADAFFEKVGAGLGMLFDLFTFLIDNIELATIALGAFIGSKIAPFIGATALALMNLGRNFLTAGANASTAATMMRGAAGGMAAAAAAAVTLRTELMILSASTGIGLAITAIGAGIGYWITQADDATSAMNTHKNIVDDVKQAYDQVRDSTNKWIQSLKTATLTQAQASLLKLADALREAKEEATAYAKQIDNMNRKAQAADPTTPYARDIAALDKLMDQFRAGDIEIEQFRQQLDSLAQTTASTAIRSMIEAILDQLPAVQELTDAHRVAQAVVSNWGKSGEEMAAGVEAAENMAHGMDGVASSTAKAGEELKKLPTIIRSGVVYNEELQKALKGVGDESEELVRKELERQGVSEATIQKLIEGMGEANTLSEQTGGRIQRVSEELGKTGDEADELKTSLQGVSEGMRIIETDMSVLNNMPPFANEWTEALAAMPPRLKETSLAATAAFQEIGEAATEVPPLAESAAASFRGIGSAIEGEFNVLAESLGDLISGLKDQLEDLKDAIEDAKSEAESARAAADSSAQGHAHGGPIFGRGTGTSDSILARLSNGEFVIRAAAVRKYGMGIFSALNNMLLPKLPAFAAGGPVDIPVDVIPHISGMLDGMASQRPKPTRVVNLTIDGQTFPGMIAPEDTAQNLLRFARKRQISSLGRKPGWHSRGR